MRPCIIFYRNDEDDVRGLLRLMGHVRFAYKWKDPMLLHFMFQVVCIVSNHVTTISQMFVKFFVSRFCNFNISCNAVLPDLEDRVVMAVMLLLVLRALWHEWVELFRKRSLEVDMRLLELVRLATPLWCISNALLALSLKERVHFNLKFIHEIQQFKNLVHKQLNPTLNYRTKSW